MKLYYLLNSGNAYKVRILLSLLNLSYDKVVVDGKKQEHKSPEFRKLNPRGEVPVLEDDGLVLWDSSACLVYLARKYGGEQWLPGDPGQMAQVMQWVALAGNEIQFGLQVRAPRCAAGSMDRGNARAGPCARTHCTRRARRAIEGQRLACARSSDHRRHRLFSVRRNRAGSKAAARFVAARREVARTLQSASGLGTAMRS